MRRVVVAFALLLALTGCEPNAYRLPEPDNAEILAVYRAMTASTPVAWRSELSEWDARERLRRAWDKVHGRAVDLCWETQRKSCRWWLDVNRSRDTFAWSHPGGRIVVQLGRADQSDRDDAIALTMAHEMAHKVLDHSALSLPWLGRGWIIGDAAGRTLGHLAAIGGYRFGRLVDLGRFYGREVGRRVISRAQEREADYFAVLIGYRAGVDLGGARADLVDRWRDQGRMRSTILNTHPIGAERIARYDRAVAEVRASGGKLPPRRTEWLGWLLP